LATPAPPAHPAPASFPTRRSSDLSTGRVYSFLLTEVSNDPSREPDLKLFVEPKEESAVAGSAGFENYVRAGEAEAYKKELDALRDRKSTRLNSSHQIISYAVFCLK